MYMILCVIDQPDQLQQVIQAWQKVGVSGMTILESTGLHRFSQPSHIPMRYALGGAEIERGNVTLISVVEQEAMIQRCLEAAESVVGDFNQPNSGIFVSWPLGFTKGTGGSSSPA